MRVVSEPRVAGVDDAGTVAVLLDEFNREFEVATPGPDVLAARLRRLLGRADVVAVLAGEPGVAVALLTFRPNVWYDGPVVLLDELYVRPERRNQGIGSAMLEFTVELARLRGCEYYEINVDSEDVDTRRFYERHGFTCIEPGQSEPALYYFREL